MARSSNANYDFTTKFYVDSGAGQCMCSCVDAFLVIRSCAIIVVGVAGSIPIHGVGTACFLVADSMGVNVFYEFTIACCVSDLTRKRISI